MNSPKVIRTPEDYRNALAAIDGLLAIVSPTQAQTERLELLSILVEDYEGRTMPVGLPDPVEAIRFRMEQDGLVQKDLQRYIGSASKVSEVLNRKVPLSLKMMRALHEGLGIPAEVLMQDPGRSLPARGRMAARYPFKEMFRYGYFDGFGGTFTEAKERAEELLDDFFADFSPPHRVCSRGTVGNSFDSNALSAWQCRICRRLADVETGPFRKDCLTPGFFGEVARLSFFDYGPRVVAEHLRKFGIRLVFEKALPGVCLDGAAFLLPGNQPVIAMTLRHERVDGFWFTLLHELVHVGMHLADHRTLFLDAIAGSAEDAPLGAAEREADRMAGNALVPESVWEEERQSLAEAEDIGPLLDFSRKCRVGLAIVIGRMLRENRKHHRFSSCLGSIHDYLPGSTTG